MRRKLFVKVLAVLMAGTMLIGCGANAGDSSQSSENLVENSTELSSQPSEEEENTEVTEVVKNEETSEEVTTESEKPEEPTPTPEPEKPTPEPEEPKQPDNPAPVHEHDYTKVVTKEPGCIYSGELGEATFTCSCGHSYTKELDTVYCDQTRDGIRVTTKEPDCQHKGKTCEHCKYCGNEIFPEDIPTIDHIPGEWLHVETQGKRYKLCTMCHITLEIEDIE